MQMRHFVQAVLGAALLVGASSSVNAQALYEAAKKEGKLVLCTDQSVPVADDEMLYYSIVPIERR